MSDNISARRYLPRNLPLGKPSLLQQVYTKLQLTFRKKISSLHSRKNCRFYLSVLITKKINNNNFKRAQEETFGGDGFYHGTGWETTLTKNKEWLQ